MQKEVTRLSGIYNTNLLKAGVTAYEERAEVVEANTVKLAKSGSELSAERILIATGGAPQLLDGLPGLEHGITSNETFLLEKFPRRMLIVGGGYVALEFSNIFHGLGAKTRIVHRGDRMLRGFDDDLRAHLHNETERAGVQADHEDHAHQDREVGGAAARDPVHRRARRHRPGAVRHRPPSEHRGLGLERAGVKLDYSGAVIVDEFSQSCVASIYAIGDVTNRMNLTPVAIRDGHAFADTVYNKRPTSVDHLHVPSAVFGRPPIGTVGLTETDARRICGEIDIYRTNFRPMRNMLSGNQERTLMKLVVERKTGKLLGVHIAGEDAPEMVQLAAVAVKAGLTKQQWDSTVALHPTAAEELVLMREPSPARQLRPSSRTGPGDS